MRATVAIILVLTSSLVLASAATALPTPSVPVTTLISPGPPVSPGPLPGCHLVANDATCQILESGDVPDCPNGMPAGAPEETDCTLQAVVCVPDSGVVLEMACIILRDENFADCLVFSDFICQVAHGEFPDCEVPSSFSSLSVADKALCTAQAMTCGTEAPVYAAVCHLLKTGEVSACENGSAIVAVYTAVCAGYAVLCTGAAPPPWAIEETCRFMQEGNIPPCDVLREALCPTATAIVGQLQLILKLLPRLI